MANAPYRVTVINVSRTAADIVIASRLRLDL